MTDRVACLVEGCRRRFPGTDAVRLVDPAGRVLGYTCPGCAWIFADVVEEKLGRPVVHAKADYFEGWRLRTVTGKLDDLRLVPPVEVPA